MTDEIQSAITSEKVETDRENYATVQADQTVEAPLVPREQPFKQLSWTVTLQKGVVYDPAEPVGIYADTVACEYGAQVAGDVFGRQEVTVEHGGAAHSRADDRRIGARVLGSVVSEGDVRVRAPAAKLDDWERRPVTVYGDVIGDYVQFDRPVVVYGNVYATEAFVTDAPTAVVGDVRSDGTLEAGALFAVSVSAAGDVRLGEKVIVTEPVVRSDAGGLELGGSVGVFSPETFHRVRADHGVDAVGLWVFQRPEPWEAPLLPADIMTTDGGTVLDRSWRTFEQSADHYAGARELLVDTARHLRDDPPSLATFRYAGVASLDGSPVSVNGQFTVETTTGRGETDTDGDDGLVEQFADGISDPAGLDSGADADGAPVEELTDQVGDDGKATVDDESAADSDDTDDESDGVDPVADSFSTDDGDDEGD